MEYNIYINQFALMKFAPAITIIEAAALWYIYRICSSKSEKLKRMVIKGDQYTWFNLLHFLSEMPLLKIKSKSTASKIISNLEQYGFVKKHIKRQGSSLYVTYTEKLDLLFTTKKSVREDEQFGKVFATGNETVREDEQNCSPQETNHNTIPYKPDHGSNDPDQIILSFNEFWSLYPRKVGKKKTLTLWKKLKPDYSLSTEIITGLNKYIMSEQWKKDDGRFIPHPTTFLNGERWTDEIDVQEKTECPF